jgi:hypothetical protein
VRLPGSEIDLGALWGRIKGEGMQDASKQGQPDSIALGSMYPAKPDSSALAKLLDEWMKGEESEQRETFEALSRSLDEDRPDGYKFSA